MQQVQNSIAFQGAYKINYRLASQNMRKQFESKLEKEGVQIFDKFEGKDNVVMYVLNDTKDIIASDYIAEHKQLRFLYYPEINETLQFSTDKPQELAEYIKTKHPKCYKLIKEVNEFIRLRRDLLFAQRLHDVNTAQQLLKKLEIKIQGRPYVQEDGVIVIKDTENVGILKMSPPSSIDFKYVYVHPNNKYDSAIRCLVDNNDKIYKYFETPDEIIDFGKGYTRAVHNYKLNKS